MVDAWCMHGVCMVHARCMHGVCTVYARRSECTVCAWCMHGGSETSLLEHEPSSKAAKTVSSSAMALSRNLVCRTEVLNE